MNPPCLTQLDVLRLERMLHSHNGLSDSETERIDTVLGNADIVPAEVIAEDVVTMNSEVVYRDLDTSRIHEVTLVYPALADGGHGRLSVASCVGAALLGMQRGARLSFVLPNGTRRRLQVLAIPFQPEAAGQYHL